MAQHNDLGIIGEAKAKDFLIQKGYQVLDTNYRFGKNELDIIAQIGNDLVIVEVKTRQNEYLSDPSLMVPLSKQKGIIKAANAYIMNHDIDLECRFDIVTVLMNKSKISIEHIESAFYPI